VIIAITMNLQQPDAHQRTLFLGDLSSGCNEFDVYKHFQRFGEIEQIKVMKGRGKKVLGYGFITFVKIESAAAAKELDGTMFQGRTLK
jgi:RNA recognition motif-containing protein